jgi:L-amino acid N-acyltransferase YncA
MELSVPTRATEGANLIVRPAVEADLPLITAIYAHAVRHGTASFEIDPPDEAEMSRRRAAVLAGGYPYVVAQVAGEVAGYAYAGVYRARPAYRATVEDSIYIAPGAQGRGIGRALLTELVATCTERGFRQMIAVIGDSGSLGSIRLHAACGFRHVGTLSAVGYKHGRWLDTVLMQRELGAGPDAPPSDRLPSS